MLINKTGSSIRSPIVLRHFAAGQKAGVFRYSAAHPREIVRASAISVSHGRLTATCPASSITLLVLPRR